MTPDVIIGGLLAAAGFALGFILPAQGKLRAPKRAKARVSERVTARDTGSPDAS